MAVIQGAQTGNVAEVDSANQILVTTNQDPTKAGAVHLYDSNGDPIITEETGALSVSQDELVFSDQVDGAALNTNKWVTSTSGMTITQSGGFIGLNAGAVTTANAYAILNSILNVPLYGDMPVEFAFNAKVTIQPQSNITIELGCGVATTTAAPTDGAFFRWTSSGAFQAVVNNGGAETISAITPAPTSNDTELFEIIISEDHVQFFITDDLVADITNPVALAFPVSAGHQSLFARVYNGSGAPSQAPQLFIGQALVRQIAVNLNRSFRDLQASLENGSYQSPTAFTQTANHANSASPSSATLSNTAAGYATLGGRWQFAAVVGAATDYALFAYQVPSPFRLYVTGVTISSAVIGAAVVTATILDWGLGVNSSAVSLATAESPPTSWAPRRVPLGMQGFLALAAIGQTATAGDIVRQFDPPLVIDSNRYFHIILQIPNGANTISLIFRGDVTVQGYFE